jgi:hypothetical protein
VGITNGDLMKSGEQILNVENNGFRKAVKNFLLVWHGVDYWDGRENSFRKFAHIAALGQIYVRKGMGKPKVMEMVYSLACHNKCMTFFLNPIRYVREGTHDWNGAFLMWLHPSN